LILLSDDLFYYLERQILPAVENIFQVFDINLKEVIEGKKQMRLGIFDYLQCNNLYILNKILLKMSKEKNLTERVNKIEPILNPNGPDIEATRELITALQTTFNSQIAGDYAKKMVQAVKKGYEIQSGIPYNDA